MELVILHGWASSTEKWDPFLEELLAKKYKPNLLKIPGLTEKITRPWKLEDYVEWLKKKIGSKKVILIGHSNGGRIAIAFTIKHPENVEKLILMDSGGIYHKEFALQIKRLLFSGIAKIGKKLTSSSSLRKIIYKLAGESDYNNADPLQKQTMVNLISTDLSEVLKNIKVPTLIIWGENDKTTPTTDGRLMHKLIKNSDFKLIKGARHSPQFTNPGEVAKIIHEYI